MVIINDKYTQLGRYRSFLEERTRSVTNRGYLMSNPERSRGI
jgi:hypothetical protein